MQTKQIDLVTHPKPFVKWVGGKVKILPQLVKYKPPYFKNYFEPFLGSGAMFFSFLPKNAVISDVNQDLIDCYQAIKHNPIDVLDTLEDLKSHHSKEFYYDVRDLLDPDELSLCNRAARFIYLNKTCFNGLYRVNQKGKFNTPIGNYKNPEIFDRDNILAVSKALQNVWIRCEPYQFVINQASAEDFIYFDPPYDETFSDYTSEGFSKDDQVKLALACHELADRGCFVMISNSDTQFVRSHYSDFHIHEIKRSGAVNSDPNKRQPVTELLITSYPEERSPF